MSKKFLKYLIYIWGVISLIAFVSVRFEGIFNVVLKEDVVDGYWDKTKYGELYYFSMIRHFREEGLPPAQPKFEHSSEAASIADCDILVFGDSFFEFSRHKQFAERLADVYGLKVHFVKHDFPLQYLAENEYSDTIPKLVLFERVERYIPVVFEEMHGNETNNISLDIGSSHPAKRLKNLIFYENSEVLYDVMLKRSFLSSGIYSFLVTLKFDVYGKINDRTPLYLVDGRNSWLFYHDQVNDSITSFYYKHSEAEMANICNNMSDLSEQLEDRYNMHLIFLPLPAKYTLYHNVINDDLYNDFLPTLYEGLISRGVQFVDVYDEFLSSDTLLYYRTDSHWNQKGIDIAFSETQDYIEKDTILNQLVNLR